MYMYTCTCICIVVFHYCIHIHVHCELGLGSCMYKSGGPEHMYMYMYMYTPCQVCATLAAHVRHMLSVHVTSRNGWAGLLDQLGHAAAHPIQTCDHQLMRFMAGHVSRE